MTTYVWSMLFGEEHVRKYIETDGEVGHDWMRGSTVLILTTTGRKSGKQYQHPLIYRESGGDYVIVASKGGAPSHPDWYLNLTEHPAVELQVGGDRFGATARDATSEERPELWELMNDAWPDYNGYQEKTDREIPVVVLARNAG